MAIHRHESNPIVVSTFHGTQTDMDEIAALHLEIRRWQESIGQNTFTDIYDSQPDLKNIIGFYIAPGGNFFVAHDSLSHELVGFVALKNEGNGHGVGKRLAVRPQYQRQGIATLLVDELQRWARANGFTKFSHRTNKGERAMAIYEKLGFEIVGFDESNEDHLLEMKWDADDE